MHSDFRFALFKGRYKDSKCWTGSSISSRISWYINLKLTFSIVFVRHNDVHIQQFSIYTKLSKTRAFENSVLSIVAYGLYLTCISLVYHLYITLTINARHTHVIYLQWNVSQCVQIWIFNISNTQILFHKHYSFDTNHIQSEFAFLFPFSIGWGNFKWR